MEVFWLLFLWLKYWKINTANTANDHIYSWDVAALGSRMLKPLEVVLLILTILQPLIYTYIYHKHKCVCMSPQVKRFKMTIDQKNVSEHNMNIHLLKGSGCSHLSWLPTAATGTMRLSAGDWWGMGLSKKIGTQTRELVHTKDKQN